MLDGRVIESIWETPSKDRAKPAQRRSACFETLAQLALLQAIHSHIGAFGKPPLKRQRATRATQ